MPDATCREGVLQVRRTGTEWLSTGWNGGRHQEPAAYNVSVPEGWSCETIGAYVDDRLEAAGFDAPGPVLLTGVDMEHARGARCDPVVVYATAGISNPAALPATPSGDARLGDSLEHGDGSGGASLERGEGSDPDGGADRVGASEFRRPGTVNLVVATTRAVAKGALANLLTVAAEAKAATLLARTGFPGTTTDAVVAGHDPAGPSAEYSGSATPVGAATRACVREAVGASLSSRYDGTDATIPDSVTDADHGVSTDVRAEVFRPADRSGHGN